ncbi:MAG: GNAT family N-acetyltransferase [Pseudomonadota bacterium]|nr:GNAT family N-acetyltransferase [Pseudomonadota bacterium]
MGLNQGPIGRSDLEPHCRAARFGAGDILRRRGHHYNDMYYIAEGDVEVEIAASRLESERLSLGPGTVIGEIGFLNGCPATANVTAKAQGAALVIDDGTLMRIERVDPALAIRLSRFLADVARERSAYLDMRFPATASVGKTGRVEVHLCRNKEMVEQAARLRYAIYCEELGRSSPYADHERKTISDGLDSFGHTFIATENDEIIGTIRGNWAAEGDLGVLKDLYGMTPSRHYPERSGICTKYMVKKERRRGPAALSLVAALTRYGLRRGASECYIDCVPPLLPYYRAMGFVPSGEAFFHYENGTSLPLRLDLERHGRKLSREPDARQMLQLYLKARMYAWLHKIGSRLDPETQTGG